jgi:RNA polymerase sigma factor for flagellar operon FliA
MRAYTQTADRAARDRLIAENIEVAKRITLRVARRCPDWMSTDDLIAAGLLGLAEAADRYDTSRGEPFVAFAEKRIRGAVLDELRRGDIMPRRVRARAREVGRTIRELEQKLGRDPDDHEIAAELGVDVAEYRDNLEMLTHVSVGSFESLPGIHERLSTDDASPEAATFKAQALAAVRGALERMPERDVLILNLYYDEEFTYAEIGELLGVTASRICQLHARAITRLRVEIETPSSKQGAA